MLSYVAIANFFCDEHLYEVSFCVSAMIVDPTIRARERNKRSFRAVKPRLNSIDRIVVIKRVERPHNLEQSHCFPLHSPH